MRLWPSRSSQTESADAKPSSGAHILATTLAAGASTVLVVFLAFAVYNDHAAHNMRRTTINETLHSLSEATAWGADNWLCHRVNMVEQLALTLSKSFDGGNALEFLHTPSYDSTFLWTYFGETDKTYHIWPPDDALPADYDPRSRPWYKAAVKARGGTLTEPYYDISTGVETITVAAPVYRGGKLLGVAAADFSTAAMSNVLARTDIGGIGYTFIVTGKGKILAHPDRSLVSKTLSDAFPGDTPQISENVQYLDDLDDPQIVIFAPLPSLDKVDWYVGIAVDKEAAFHSIHKLRLSAAIATVGAAMLLILVLGVVVHRLLVQPLTKARQAADAANVAKSEFLASMSHEIRTPMNGVLGMAEVLMNTGLDHRQRELAQIIVSSGNALMTVINDVLDFAKLEAGKLQLSPRSFNLRQTVHEIATMMQARAVEKDIEMIVRYAPDLPEGVIADDARLRQVLGNLIGNAVKFTDHGYVLVDVTGEREGDKVHFHFGVRDTGIGIAAGQIPRMFEKFEQADGSHTRRFGGTGLGLAICKNIVGMMGGEIGAESQPGKGSEFWFTLDLAVDDSVRTMPVEAQSQLDGARILAVDDNPVNRRILKELLDGWGMRSTIAADHLQAMAALERSVSECDRYHAILMDFQMPDVNGVALAKRIQENEKFASIPVIILSSIDDALAGGHSEGANIVEFLSKPVRPSQLMDALISVLADDAPKPLQAVASALKPDAAPRDAAPGDDRIRVLVAEDNLVNQMVITQLIDKAAYDVTVAENGEKAVQSFKTKKPDVVLMDLSMPVMDGFEATRKIRAAEAAEGTDETPIIATTAHVLEEDRRRCYEAGMNDFLTKPIKKAALETALERWAGGDALIQRAG